MEVEDTPENLDRFFDAVRILNMRGFISTMPYKTKMLPYMDVVTEESKVFNCINAVKYVEGKFHGAGFDGYGFCQSIEDTGVKLEGREALILGAGGICGPVAAEMARRGGTSFTILNRTEEKAKKLAQLLQDYTGKPAYGGPLTPEKLEHAAKKAEVVAQCTSAGIHGSGTEFPHLDFLKMLGKDTVVMDALYNPPQTVFLKVAAECGLKTVNGMGMLSNQASILIDFFFGAQLPNGKEDALRAIDFAMERKGMR
jgi:shikimate dehydrogenase